MSAGEYNRVSSGEHNAEMICTPIAPEQSTATLDQNPVVLGFSQAAFGGFVVSEGVTSIIH
jgi:hypothetical protein